MSTPTMATFAAVRGTIEVGRAGTRCSVCDAALPPGGKLMAALRETAEGFDRVDVCTACWETFDHAGLLAFWQASVRTSTAKPKRFVDDDVLCDLFERLADAPEPAKVNFRFVLGLILMRKRLLAYEASRAEAGRDVWVVRRRGRPDRLDLLNPHLDEQQVAEVSRQLGDILNEDL